MSARELVIVANRLPVRQVRASGDASEEGELWERSPGGLVAAVQPAVSTSRTQWVGWCGSPSGDEGSFDHDGIELHPVAIDAATETGFYAGFSNSTLWPLYHDAIVVPEFDPEHWTAYCDVNLRFAQRTAKVAPHGATVWVHDYQLQLVPGMLRELRDDLRIGFFLHTPFPSQELFLRVPWRSELMEGLLGADLVGFQTQVGAENFRVVAKRLFGATVSNGSIVHDGRVVGVRNLPVGIDATTVRRLATDPATAARAAQIRADLGHPRTVLLGVDRLDYTKGIEVRLRAYQELLAEGRIDPEHTVLVQVAQPSRDQVPGYHETRLAVERIVGQIHGDFGGLGVSPIEYLHQSQGLEELVALYRAADVMLVTPLRDGMNLVAKEYVASRVDGTGVLILSEFAGAAHQLRAADLVNPFDVRSLKDAIVHAIEGDSTAQRRRMRSLQRSVHRQDATRWASAFLDALEGR